MSTSWILPKCLVMKVLDNCLLIFIYTNIYVQITRALLYNSVSVLLETSIKMGRSVIKNGFTFFLKITIILIINMFSLALSCDLIDHEPYISPHVFLKIQTALMMQSYKLYAVRDSQEMMNLYPLE